MAYDEDLAHRIRELVAAQRGLAEKKMFGGIAFLVGGSLAVAARQLRPWVERGASHAGSLPAKRPARG